MNYLFLLFFFAFVILCTIYLIKNDFASETTEVIFPAAGAVLLSFYLGFKAIAIDAPEPKRFGATVAILHDQENGRVDGLAPRSISYPHNSLDEFRGAVLIGELPLYNSFKDLNLTQTLTATSEAPRDPSIKLIEYLLEYSILRWLQNPDMVVGYEAYRTTRLIHAGGGGGGVPTDLVGVKTSRGISENNPFMKAEEVVLMLPEGSSVLRSEEKDSPRIDIYTRHSHVRIWLSGPLAELLGSPIGPDATQIYEATGLPANPNGLYLNGFNVEFEASQRAFSRFSEQAKKEAKWIERIETQFERDFSWERLRALYTNK